MTDLNLQNKVHVLVLKNTYYEKNPGLIEFAKIKFSELIKKEIIYVCQLLCKDIMVIGKLIDQDVVWSHEPYNWEQNG